MSYTCQQTRQQISEALDEGAALVIEAVNHVSNCGDCTRFGDDARALETKLARTVPAFHVASVSALPEGFHERVLAAAKEDSDASAKIVGFPKWLMPTVGAAAAAVMIAFVVLRGDGDPDVGSWSAAVAVVPPTAPVVENPPPATYGLPGAIEIPFDVAALPAVAERSMTDAFSREADAMASDILKVRDFFASRTTVVSNIGL
jgi:hypothetical protein